MLPLSTVPFDQEKAVLQCVHHIWSHPVTLKIRTRQDGQGLVVFFIFCQFSLSSSRHTCSESSVSITLQCRHVVFLQIGQNPFASKKPRQSVVMHGRCRSSVFKSSSTVCSRTNAISFRVICREMLFISVSKF